MMLESMLFHISEEPNIERFEPRMPESGGAPVVWAIAAERLHNYLLPRDCPRVTFYAGPGTRRADIDQFLGAGPSVVAVESEWYERIRNCRLYRYQLPPDTFECIDECANYFVSRDAVVPASVQIIDDPIREIVLRGVEFRLMTDLWPLHDAVAASTLQFSMIRMRNARRKLEKPA